MIRATSGAGAEATARALLVAWTLTARLAARVQDGLTAQTPAAGTAPADGPAVSRPVSLWRLAEVSLRTLAQVVPVTGPPS